MIEINGKMYKIYDFEDIDQTKYHGFIYVTVNKINGKKYVGQHIRWKKDYIGSGKYLWYSIRKNGRENFERFIIDLAVSQEEIDEKETYWINEGFGVKTAKSKDWYNCKDGAQNGGNMYAGLSEEVMKDMGRRKSVALKRTYAKPEVKKRHSDALKKAFSTPEAKKKLSENNARYWLGKKRSKDTIEKVSAAHRGVPLSEEHRRRISESEKGEKHHFYGKKLSEEHRRKLSSSHKGKPLSEDHKRKIGEASKIAYSRPEARENLIKAMNNPETKQKLSKAMKGKSHSEEARRKISENSAQAREVVVLKDSVLIDTFSTRGQANKWAKENKICSRLQVDYSLITGELTQATVKMKNGGGYKFMYLEDYEKSLQPQS